MSDVPRNKVIKVMGTPFVGDVMVSCLVPVQSKGDNRGECTTSSRIAVGPASQIC